MPDPSQLTDASWQDRVFVTVTRKSDQTSFDFHGLLNEIGFGGGEKDFEGDPLMNGGRIRRRSAQADEEFTGTLYPVGADAGDGTARPEGLHEFFYESGDQADPDEGAKFQSSLNRRDYRVVVLWTNDPNVSDALTTVAAEYAGYRKVMRDCQLTDVTLNFDDMVLTAEVTFKAPVFDEKGVSTVYVESCKDNGTDTLPAVNDGGTYDESAP